MEKDTVAEMIDSDERFESIMFNMENAIERYFLTLNGRTELIYCNLDAMKDALGLDGIQKIARDYHLHFSQLYRYWEDNFAPTLLEHEGIDMSEYPITRRMMMLYDALNNLDMDDIFGSPFVNFNLYGVNTLFGITLHFGGFVWSDNKEMEGYEYLWHYDELDVCVDLYWVAPWSKKTVNGGASLSVPYSHELPIFEECYTFSKDYSEQNTTTMSA